MGGHWKVLYLPLLCCWTLMWVAEDVNSWPWDSICCICFHFLFLAENLSSQVYSVSVGKQQSCCRHANVLCVHSGLHHELKRRNNSGFLIEGWYTATRSLTFTHLCLSPWKKCHLLPMTAGLGSLGWDCKHCFSGQYDEHNKVFKSVWGVFLRYKLIWSTGLPTPGTTSNITQAWMEIWGAGRDVVLHSFSNEPSHLGGETPSKHLSSLWGFTQNAHRDYLCYVLVISQWLQ